jgi:hypothetical protein
MEIVDIEWSTFPLSSKNSRVPFRREAARPDPVTPSADRFPAKRANSRHFQRQSMSANSVSRSHSKGTGQANNLYEGSSLPSRMANLSRN